MSPVGDSQPPCGWVADYSECSDTSVLTDLPAEDQERFEGLAVEYLWRWTGKALGVCDVVVRPCRQDCWEGQSTFFGSGPRPAGSGPWTPVVINGAWYNVGCGICSDDCSCTDTPAIRLPGPVASVSQIRIDGVVLPPDSYRVDNQKLLIRTDGDRWPVCQDMSAAPSETDTWEITYQRGLPVPVGGQIAAGLLALELAKAACNDKSCALPQRVQTVTRQGVTVAVLDSFDDIDTGHTGIWLIDAWVASITKPPVRSRVYSPDVPRNPYRRTTWS